MLNLVPLPISDSSVTFSMSTLSKLLAIASFTLSNTVILHTTVADTFFDAGS